MPVMDGIEAARILKQKMNAHEIPPAAIVALSAQPLKSEECDYFYNEVGFSAYITKPICKDGFLGVLKKFELI